MFFNQLGFEETQKREVTEENVSTLQSRERVKTAKDRSDRDKHELCCCCYVFTRSLHWVLLATCGIFFNLSCF